MTRFLSRLGLYLLTLLLTNMGILFLGPGNGFRTFAAILLLAILPGLPWAYRLFPTLPFLGQTVLGAAISYIYTNAILLQLHYLTGPVEQWHLLVAFNVFALLPFVPLFQKQNTQADPSPAKPKSPVYLLSLLLVIAAALFLRFGNLGYSEFQGDEALAMISAAEALEGHEDALFLRSKGPGEVLLPMAMWRLNGIINEFSARLPFIIASLAAIVTIYLIGQALNCPHLGWLAALIFSLNGFTVAFGRIVQYQALVLWMSSLAFLLILYQRKTGQRRYALLSGLCLGTGLLAHYDTILVLPAIGWLLLPSLLSDEGQFSWLDWWTRFRKATFIPIILFISGTALISLPFYWPYSLDPQANRTGAYVGNRIGNELRNNLPDFFHFNTFYSSFYYIVLTSLLVMGALIWLIGSQHRRRWWLGLLLGLASLLIIVWPTLLRFEINLRDLEYVDLAILPFFLLLLVAVFSLPLTRKGTSTQALIGWLAVPFLGYNFVVALGLTHIYTIVPAWSLLAAWAVSGVLGRLGGSTEEKRSSHSTPSQPPPARGRGNSTLFTPSGDPVTGGESYPLITTFAITLLTTLIFAPFLWNAFVRNDIEYLQDYPAGNLGLFWTPYEETPKAGFFGFAHRTGWKAVGQKIVIGELAGDYGSNEEPDVTMWYTRGAPRACDSTPEFYFIADDLVDEVETPADIIAERYETVGTVTLPNTKQMQVLQQIPTNLALNELSDVDLAWAFDQSATPTAFARAAQGTVDISVNFGNVVELIGYDLDTRRAYPGGRVPVTLYWRALQPIPENYQIFTHLENDTVGLLAQADGVPVCWTFPTDLWRPGQIIADQHAIAIPPDAPLDSYPLNIGLYHPDTFQRLDFLDIAGNPAGTSFQLATVEIVGE